MKMVRPASAEDVEAVGKMYDAVNAYFERTINYCAPNWKKGVYPASADARRAYGEGSLFVRKEGERVVGSVVIDGSQHPEYRKIPWGFQGPDNQVMVLHTLVVDPDFRNCKVGEEIVRFAIEYCRNRNAKAIRLDTHYRNLPARKLYEKCGFCSMGLTTAFINGEEQEFDVFEYLL